MMNIINEHPFLCDAEMSLSGRNENSLTFSLAFIFHIPSHIKEAFHVNHEKVAFQPHDCAQEFHNFVMRFLIFVTKK